MSQKLTPVKKLFTMNQLILNNRLLSWNRSQSNQDWLEQYLFKGDY
jgi:hypothetical protein